MNAKGDAPYDFTCDSSHQCQNCKKYVRMFSNEKTNRDVICYFWYRRKNRHKKIKRMFHKPYKNIGTNILKVNLGAVVPKNQCAKNVYRSCKPMFRSMKKVAEKHGKSNLEEWQLDLHGWLALITTFCVKTVLNLWPLLKVWIKSILT